VTWKSYQENYPKDQGCFTRLTTSDYLYVRKHNPFISFKRVQETPELCAKVVNADELSVDANYGTVPQLVYFTPNMDDDGHDTTVRYATSWLEKFMKTYLHHPKMKRRTLFFITFDERENYQDGKEDGENKVFTLMLGDVMRKGRGRRNNRRFDHYDMLRTVEENWGLGTLGREDKKAKVLPVG